LRSPLIRQAVDNKDSINVPLNSSTTLLSFTKPLTTPSDDILQLSARDVPGARLLDDQQVRRMTIAAENTAIAIEEEAIVEEFLREELQLTRQRIRQLSSPTVFGLPTTTQSDSAGPIINDP
jgi:hypothetical protein